MVFSSFLGEPKNFLDGGGRPSLGVKGPIGGGWGGGGGSPILYNRAVFIEGL